MVFGRRFIVGDILKKKLFFFTVRATFDDLRNWFFADLSVPQSNIITVGFEDTLFLIHITVQSL